MPNLRKIATTFAVILLIASTIAGMVQIAYSETTNDDVLKQNPLLQEATSLIEANHILIENRDLSTVIAIGTVKKVESVLLNDKTGMIVTNAEICVEVPLTDNIQPNDTLVVRYVGGSVGNLTLRVYTMWAYGSEDTVSLPGVMKLEGGEKVLFFGRQEEAYLQLLAHLPFPAGNAEESNNHNGNGEYMLLSETQPSTC